MPRLPDVDDLGARPIPESRRQLAVVRNPGAIAEAVTSIGNAGFRAGAELDELDQRRQAAQAGRDFAEMVGEVEQETNKRRDAAEPGAAGHMELVRPYVEQRTGQFLTGIRDSRVRQQFEVNAAQLRARVLAGEDAWAIGERRTLAVANAEQANGLLELSLRNHPDASALQNYLDVTRSTILGHGLTGNVAEALVRRHQSRLVRAYLQGQKERNPTAALEILERGTLNQYLDPDDQQPLIDGAQAEIARLEAEGRRELAAARSQATQELNLAQRRLRDGDPTVTEADLDRWQTLAQNAQLPAELYDTVRARIIYETNNHYRTASAVEVQQAITDLSARIAQQGPNASPDDVVRRDHLQAMLPRIQQRDNNDPVGRIADLGGNVAPLNFQDPGAIRNRVAAARAGEQESGRFVPIRPAELPILQARLASGPAGRMEIIEDLAAVRAVDARTAIAMARQIAPQDAALRHAMRMGPDARGLVARGTEARGLLPSSLEAPDGQMGSFNNITQRWFSSHIAPSLNRLEVDFSDGTLEAARSIYAERMRQSGRLAQAEFDEPAFAAAVDTALGRTANGQGGMGRWNFGPRAEDGDFPGVLLPGGMNQAEFSRRFANLPRPDAQGNRNWNGAANGTPIWGDGSRVNNEDIRRRFVPVAVGDGIYQFRYGNQVLHRREGGPFQINIRRVPMGAAPLQQQPVSLRRDGQPTPVRPALPPRPVYTPRNTTRPGG